MIPSWRRAAAWFALVTLVLYSPIVLGGRHFVEAGFLYRTPLWYDAAVPVQNFDLFDQIIFYYPNDTLLNEGLKQGRIPMWNPYNFCGHPLLSDGQSGFLYPPRLLLHALLPVATAHDAIMLLHTFLAGLAMYFFARRLAMSEIAAMLTGTAWMLNGNTMGWLVMEFSPILAALVPLALLALERARERPATLPGAAVTIAFMLLAGHLQFVLYSLLIVFLMGGYRAASSENPRRAWLQLAISLVGGALIASPLLLPFLETMRGSQRPNIPLSYLIATFRQFLLTAPPTLIAPDAFGNPVNDFAIRRITEGGNWIFPETCCYVGIAPLLLACLGAAGARRPGLARFLTAVLLLTLVVPATPLYGLLYLLPGPSRIIASRDIIVFVFAATLLAGLGLDRLNEARKAPRILQGAAVLLLFALAVAAATVNTMPLAQTVRSLVDGQLVRLPDREMFFTDADFIAAVKSGFLRNYSWTSPSVFMPLLWLAAFTAVIRARKYRALLLLALTACDLAAFGLHFTPTSPRAMIFPSTPTLRFLQQNIGHDRVMGVGTIRPNTALPFRLQDIGGYESVYPRDAADTLVFLQTGKLPPPDQMLPPAMFPLTRWRSPLASLMGVRYFVAYPGQALEGLPLVDTETLPVYENPRRVPRAFVAGRARTVPDRAQMLTILDSPDFDPRREVLLDSPADAGADVTGEARITAYGTDEVRLQASSSADAWLVLTDTYSPGWTATVDGQPAEIRRADAMFRAVRLPAGAHDVVFRYEPVNFRLGIAVSTITMIFLLALSRRQKLNLPVPEPEPET